MKFKALVILTFLIATVFFLSGFMPQPETRKFVNLKVLPKDITKDDLDEVMDGFKGALGVKCGFCHAPKKDDPKRLDFASDEKPEKATARKMMKMTVKLNQKYFHVKDADIPNAVLAVNCITCHRGNTEPKKANVPMEKKN
jgi:hypothetical protein